MAVLDLFSKRQRRLRGEVPEVYRYDDLPRPLRIQIVHVFTEAIGVPDYGSMGMFGADAAGETYRVIVKALRRERGQFQLAEQGGRPYEELVEYFLQEKDVELALDVVELCFTLARPLSNVATAGEVNARFREHGVGYQVENGQVVRVDSEFIHADVVRPALTLLHNPMFAGPEQEYRQAHEHYRHGRYKESLVESLKALESTMKAIADARRWPYDKRATASALVRVCFDNGLVPQWLETQFSSLRQLLESGVPTVRNKTAGHGQGAVVQDVPEHIAAYGLHLAATNIVFLAKAHEALGP